MSMCYPRLVLCFMFASLTFGQSRGQTYTDVKAIFSDKLGRNNYNKDVRPRLNQSDVLVVGVTFELLSIVQVDDVSQSFTCNGFMIFGWLDEIIAWDPADYGGQIEIVPRSKDIWRPKVVLINTLGDRDIFADDNAPTIVDYNGMIQWLPGSLFQISCALDLTYFPFDEQTCHILFMAMGYTVKQLQYVSLGDVERTYYTPNGEWELTDTKIETYNLALNESSTIQISFTIKRNPTFLLVNIILPVVFLSALNLLVFIIPAGSGEKIGYGITVLLALAVFLSFVSGMLPRSSDNVPKVTIYLFVLLTLSILTVIDSIIIVFLHHKEEREEKNGNAKDNFQNAFDKMTPRQRAVHSMGSPVTGPSIIGQTDPRSADRSSRSSRNKCWPYISNGNNQGEDSDEKSSPNKYKSIGKYIDLVSLVVFSLIWISLTMGFMIDIALR